MANFNSTVTPTQSRKAGMFVLVLFANKSFFWHGVGSDYSMIADNVILVEIS